MWSKFAAELKRELETRFKKVEKELRGKIIEIEAESAEDAPPPVEQRSPSAFTAPDPVFGGGSAMQQFAAMTAPVTAPFAVQAQSRKQPGIQPGSVSEKEKEEAVQDALFKAMQSNFPGVRYSKGDL